MVGPILTGVVTFDSGYNQILYFLTIMFCTLSPDQYISKHQCGYSAITHQTMKVVTTVS